MPFAIGERVRTRSNPALTGEIVAVLTLEQGDRAYRVRFANGVRLVVETSLEPNVRGKDAREQLAEGSLAPLAALRLLLTAIRLKQLNLTDQVRSLRAARLEHFRYQYKPLLSSWIRRTSECSSPMRSGSERPSRQRSCSVN
jgi:hypothetical protein